MITISTINFIAIACLGWINVLSSVYKSTRVVVLSIAIAVVLVTLTVLESRSDETARGACIAAKDDDETIANAARLCDSLFPCLTGSTSLCVFKTPTGYRSITLEAP